MKCVLSHRNFQHRLNLIVMKHTLLLLGLLLAFAPFSNGQKYDPLHSPNSYQSSENPHYWKNRKPYGGYWQQDVHYTLTGDIDEKNDQITGHEKLVYTNNSPDVLKFVYFHLYQNAFQPDSYYDKLLNATDQPKEWGENESAKKGTTIENLTVNGETVKTELDNTVLKIWLPQPLPPGKSMTFEMDFKTWFDIANSDRRMKTFNSAGQRHYDGVHWYPRISVYDRKFGWTTDQHLSHEFYGDFGAFDVELTFASNYVVGATGYLQNRGEMLPADLRSLLDIKNFKDKPWGEAPSVITPYDSTQRKTWKYHAENVHDFAFTADPNYRISEYEWDGVNCIALAQESHASGWQNAAEYTAKVIETFSNDFGRYVYHKMIVADARDGMEYPMLTLDGGYDPEYRSLLVHEIGHNWFFGQVGTNETYRAAMDEGFTQFLNVYGLEAIDGDTLVEDEYSSKYVERYTRPLLARMYEAYGDYLQLAIRAEDPPLNTHSDGFYHPKHGDDRYWQVYNKTAVMLYNLQYVLGDELFLKAMQHYFSQWKIAHPYPEDFRMSVTEYTHVDLNWFFDQWLETSKRIDYGITGIHKDRKSDKADQYIIEFRRFGEMQMPIDFRVTGKDGNEYNFHIPNSWFVKETEAVVLPRWIGWDKLQQDYQAVITVPGGIKNVEIDPTWRLADVNMLNNSKKLPLAWHLDSRVYNEPDFRYYEIHSRPEVWWNGFDGAKVGLHVHSDYMRYKNKFDGTVWFNTGVLQNLPNEFTDADGVNNDFDAMSYRLSYETGAEKLSKGARFFASVKDLDGLFAGSLGFNKQFENGKDYLRVYVKTMHRDSAGLTYLLDPQGWTPEQWNNTLNVRWTHQYDYTNGYGFINLNLRSTTIGSDYDFAQASLEVINRSRVGKLGIHTRAFAQYGTGNNTPLESSLMLAGANNEQLMDNKYTRAVGFFDHAWRGYGDNVNHFQMGGGLNLRGYAGYVAPELDDVDSLRLTFRGTSGASASIEVDLQRLIPWQLGGLSNIFDLDYYLFADAGIINMNTPSEIPAWGYLRMDAGFGATLTIHSFPPLEMTKPLTIRCDLPFFLNSAPDGTEFIEMRYVIGINRSF